MLGASCYRLRHHHTPPLPPSPPISLGAVREGHVCVWAVVIEQGHGGGRGHVLKLTVALLSVVTAPKRKESRAREEDEGM